MLLLFIRAVRRMLGLVPCDICGSRPGRSLVVTADPAGRMMDFTLGQIVKVYCVESALFLCKNCKEQIR